MKCQINAFFEPDLLWAGEINRQTMKLERKLGVSMSRRANLDCSLWRSIDSKAGIGLTLNLENTQLCEKAENASEIVATRRAFDALAEQVDAHFRKSGKQFFELTRPSPTSAPTFEIEPPATGSIYRKQFSV